MSEFCSTIRVTSAVPALAIIVVALLSYIHHKPAASPHRILYTLTHLCKLGMSSLICLLTFSMWVWQLTLSPFSFSWMSSEFLLFSAWLASSLLLRSEFVKIGGNSKYLAAWWIISLVCEVILIPLRVVTSEFFITMAIGEIIQLLIMSLEALLTVGGLVWMQDIDNSHYFEFNMEQYVTEDERPKPVEQIWEQFEAIKQRNEESRNKEVKIEQEVAPVREVKAYCFETLDNGRLIATFKIVVKRGGKSEEASDETTHTYKDCCKLRAHLQATYGGLKVPEMPQRKTKEKRLTESDVKTRKAAVEKLMKWITDNRIDDSIVQSFFNGSGWEYLPDSEDERKPVVVIDPMPAPIDTPVIVPASSEGERLKLTVVLIGTFESSGILRRFAVYELAVYYGQNCQVINKRFSEFKALDYALRPKYSIPEFPDYSYRQSSVDQEVIEERKFKLQAYINELVESEARDDPELFKFLNLAV